MKSDILNNELDYINRPDIKEWTKATLNNVPDYFWVAKASSSGKYHPACTNKEGGLIVHVKRVVYLADRLCEGWGIKDEDRDIVLSACILHDIAKTPGTSVMHLYRMNVTSENFVNHPLNANKYYDTEKKWDTEFIKIVHKIHQCISHHMGLWTPERIKKPFVDYSLKELAVYTCDYMATTKTLETPVDNDLCMVGGGIRK